MQPLVKLNNIEIKKKKVNGQETIQGSSPGMRKKRATSMHVR